LPDLLVDQQAVRGVLQSSQQMNVNGGVKAYHWGVAKVGQLVSRLGA